MKMNELKDYVDFRLTHSDKHSEAQGYPLELSDCKKHKPMRDLKIYGNSFQDGTPSPETPIEVQSVGELVTDEADANYGKYKIPVVQRGINLFDSDLWLSYFDKLEDGSYHSNNTIKSDLTIPFSLKAGTYTISLDVKYPPNCRYRPYMLDRDGNTIYNWNIANNNDDEWRSIKFTFTSTVDIAYMYWGYNINTNDMYFRNFQIQENSAITPYEPYIEPITTNIFLNEPLCKLGDYADYIDFKENKVVRNVREIVYKGGEIIKCYKEYVSKGFYLWQTSVNIYDDADLSYFSSWTTNFPEKSTHLIACSSLSSDCIKPNNWYVNRSFGIHFALAPETYASDGVEATVEDINNWLASQYENGTPVKFNYILAEPIEEPLNIDLPKLTAKTTIIEVDTSLAPSNAYGKYIKK